MYSEGVDWMNIYSQGLYAPFHAYYAANQSINISMITSLLKCMLEIHIYSPNYNLRYLGLSV